MMNSRRRSNIPTPRNKHYEFKGNGVYLIIYCIFGVKSHVKRYISKYHITNDFPSLMFATETSNRRQSWEGEKIHSSNRSFNGENASDSSRLGNKFSETDSAKRRGSNSSVDSRLVNIFTKV
jgi:hypothetical protein